MDAAEPHDFVMMLADAYFTSLTMRTLVYELRMFNLSPRRFSI